ncbi:serine hydrolase domain-containing protein [Virgibacillus sp. SK37]|uniref:serine hydrolase domain-containing protein n=1 Tax=Virgibacillus sp. SK37 TaxID=403957 RepID=UPI0004D14792|nr:serine hydrolase domain-containing protein [Virgibacillus sp. SK37]AIF44210.1 beta-lactamase [Virgibacillus sp. SK37]
MKKTVFLCISLLLSTSIIFSSHTNVYAEADKPPAPTIENKNTKQVVPQKTHPVFSWGAPGPTSPVLHPGSARGAGMIKTPLLRIDQIMTEMINKGTMPGAVTLVARRGHIVQHKAYGDAFRYTDDKGTEAESPVSMRKNTIFDLASISKIFTTTAAMKLYEEDYFELDDPVAKYIPEFAENGKQNVTIEQLMTHTSGFKAWIPLYTIGENREERLHYVFQYPLSNEPGSIYTYSDLNMITLGALIERLSGQRLDEFVADQITKPLKMNDTMYNPAEHLKQRIAATEFQPWTDRGLVWGEVHDESAWSLDGVAGHAGVFSTAKDLAKLAHMFVNDGHYGGKQILQPETVSLLVNNQIPQFPGDEHGLGWELSQSWYMDGLSEANSIGHTGYTGTSLVINQNNDTIAILLTNRVHPTRETVSTNPARRQFARQVADAIPVKIPGKQKAWFSGYGDQLNRTLTAELTSNKAATLTFDTWYRTEANYDMGLVEISSDGKNWSTVHPPFTGSSVGWKSTEIQIPANATHIRFRYKTDTYNNGRGWYVANLELETENGGKLPLSMKSDEWTKRSY